MNHDWREHAACKGLHPNLFHADRGDSHSYKQALRVCDGDPDENIAPCPVRSDCLNWILTALNSDNDLHGIYGGTLPTQRAELRRNKQRHIEREQRHIERENTPEPTPAPVVTSRPEPVPAPAVTPAVDPVEWVARYRVELLSRMEREQAGKEDTATLR